MLMNTEFKNTHSDYSEIISHCLSLFLLKTKDYGTAWRILRPLSIVEQIYIKLQRIKTIQENQTQKISDSVAEEFIGVLNYSVIGLMQLELQNTIAEDLPLKEVEEKYRSQIAKAESLMTLKNHDYGEAWRSLSETSFVDLMLMKIYRMKQIIANNEKTLVSEGLEANYLDLINYATFVQILFYKK